MSVVELVGVWKSVGGEAVLRGVDLELGEGVIAVVRGRSGVGKTTLAKVVALLSKPDRGLVRFLGMDVSSLGDSQLSTLRLRYIGFADQECTLVEGLSAWENAELSLKLLGVEKSAREKVLKELFELFGLIGLEERKPRELSGGQKQRVVLIRALAKKPRLFVADEPFAHLDNEAMRTVLEYVKQLAKESSMTALITTTDLYTPLDVDEEFVLESGVLRKKS